MMCRQERQLLAKAAGNFFLHGFAKPEVESLIDEVLLETGRQNKRACILVPRLMVWLVVSMSLYRNSSIVNVFERLVAWARESESRLRRGIISEEAIYHARRRLGALPLRRLFQRLKPQKPTLPKSFHGLRVFGIDGTNFSVPDTAQNSAVFRRHKTQGRPAAFPQVQAVLLTELTTHRLLDCCFTPCLSNEVSTLPFLIKNLGVGDLLLLDRGLSSFGTMSLCKKRGINFLVRISTKRRLKIKEKLSDGDYIVDIKSSGMTRKRTGLKVLSLRLLDFKVGENERVRLLTDLTDSETFRAIELAQLYHQRWECEVTYRELKSGLLVTSKTKMPTHFRSKTPIGVVQECWGLAIAHLLTRELMDKGATAGQIKPLSLSFTNSLKAIKALLPSFQRRKAKKRLRQKLIRDISTCLIDRPRRPRRFPRVIKSRNGRTPLKREHHKETPLDLSIHFQPLAC